MAFNRSVQEVVLIIGLPEGIIRTPFFSLQFHLLGQQLHQRAEYILYALGEVPLVIQVVLNTKHTVAADGALHLRARAMPVK